MTKSAMRITDTPVFKPPEPSAGQTPTIATVDKIFWWGRERSGLSIYPFLFIETFASTIVLQNCTKTELTFEGAGEDSVDVSPFFNDKELPTFSYVVCLRDDIVLSPRSFYLIPASTYFTPLQNAELAKGNARLGITILLKGQDTAYITQALVFVRQDADHFRAVPPPNA